MRHQRRNTTSYDITAVAYEKKEKEKSRKQLIMPDMWSYICKEIL